MWGQMVSELRQGESDGSHAVVGHGEKDNRVVFLKVSGIQVPGEVFPMPTDFIIEGKGSVSCIGIDTNGGKTITHVSDTIYKDSWITTCLAH